jgi:hypothetical protein
MKATWNRFTWVDAGILVAALALGAWLQTSQMSRRTDHPFRRAETLAIWVGSSVVWAGLLAGPLIIGAQFLRGRRTAPSPGEWFWLVPIPLSLTFLAFLYYSESRLARMLFKADVELYVFIIYIFAQSLFSLAAVVRLVSSVLGRRADVACRWTDLVGCSVCSALGPVTAFAIISALRQLP